MPASGQVGPATTGRADPALTALLRDSPLFAPLDAGIQRELAARVHRQAFHEGELIVREGASGDSCFLIEEGEVAVVTASLTGHEVVLAVLGAGEVFGEAALVTGEPRSASVRALDEVRCQVVDEDTWGWLLEAAPEFESQLRSRVDVLQVDRFLKRASPFFRLPNEALLRLAGELEPVSFAPGDLIVREGETGDCFYLIQSGRVEVVRRGRRLAVLGVGDHFGETALLAADRRTATVRALDRTDALMLTRPAFEAVVHGNPELARHFREILNIRYAAAPRQPLVLPDPLTTMMPFVQASRRRRYRRLLVAGLGLFALLSTLGILAPHPVLVYALVAVGAFIGPVVYVIYMADSSLLTDRPRDLAITFLLAAALGLPLAIAVEQLTDAQPGRLLPSLLVGFIEEPAKVLGVLWLLSRRSFRFQMDGVIFGAAAGMGFAAFESALYGLARMGTPPELLITLWVRSLLSPFGHGTWTAIVCATIWREKGAFGLRLNPRVAGGFGVAILLHGLWDWQPLPLLLSPIWWLAVGVLGLWVLRGIIHRAVQDQGASLAALSSDSGPAEARSSQIHCHVCGTLVRRGARYCPRCGLALVRPDARSSARSVANPGKGAVSARGRETLKEEKAPAGHLGADVHDGAQHLLYAQDFSRLNSLRRLYERLLPVPIDPATQELPEPVVREATILFTDLRGFSSVAERFESDPGRLLSMLNEHFEVVVRAILRCDGTVEKLLGDGVFATFGAWQADPDHAARGTAAALAVLGANEGLNRRRAEAWGQRLEVGVGVCSGKIVAGVAGPAERFEFSVFGDPVNIASRLVADARPGEALFGPSTYEALAGQVLADLLGSQTIRGREGRISVYSIRLTDPKSAPAERKAA